MFRRYTLCLSAIGCLAATQSTPGKVFLKYSYKTLEVICPDDECRWSIPLPVNSFNTLAGLPSGQLMTNVNEAVKDSFPDTNPPSGSPQSVWMKVDIANPIHRKERPFGGWEKKGTKDPHFGPALIKRFGDYEVITCQGKKPEDGKTLRDLVTYAVKKEMGVKEAGEDGTSLQHIPNLGGGIRKSDDYRADICVAKYADLGGKLSERTAQRFCYFLTHTILNIYQEIGFVSLGSGPQLILTEEEFQALGLTSTHDLDEGEGGDAEGEE